LYITSFIGYYFTLHKLGHDVHVIVDACSSQQPFDRQIALDRMSNAGAFLTTAQSAIFMLLGGKYESEYD